MKCPEEINKILFIKRETYDVVCCFSGFYL